MNSLVFNKHLRIIIISYVENSSTIYEEFLQLYFIIIIKLNKLHIAIMGIISH